MVVILGEAFMLLEFRFWIVLWERRAWVEGWCSSSLQSYPLLYFSKPSLQLETLQWLNPSPFASSSLPSFFACVFSSSFLLCPLPLSLFLSILCMCLLHLQSFSSQSFHFFNFLPLFYPPFHAKYLPNPEEKELNTRRVSCVHLLCLCMCVSCRPKGKDASLIINEKKEEYWMPRRELTVLAKKGDGERLL